MGITHLQTVRELTHCHEDWNAQRTLPLR